jgi:hypothetical protein
MCRESRRGALQLSGATQSKSFHESYRGEGVKPPSDRSAGMVFAVAAVVAAVWWRNAAAVPWIALGAAGMLAALSLAAPRVLRPLNLAWFKIGQLLHRVVNPVVMLLMFAMVFLPAGLLMRMWSDPLRSRRAAPGASYWIERTDAPGHGARGNSGAMTNQF